MEAVGFTVHHQEGHYDYSSGQTIRFSDIQSNFGGYFNTDTFSFVCPYRGIYFFTVSFNAYESYDMHIEIVKGNVKLAYAMAEQINVYAHSSAFVVTLCEEGEIVKTQAGGGTTDVIHNGRYRANQFSGYLLHRYY